MFNLAKNLLENQKFTLMKISWNVGSCVGLYVHVVKIATIRIIKIFEFKKGSRDCNKK